MALGRLGQAAMQLANQSQARPLGGRQYELWQPIMAMAMWLDEQRKEGSANAKTETGIDLTSASSLTLNPPSTHASVLKYAQRLCDTGSVSLLPEEDFLLL